MSLLGHMLCQGLTYNYWRIDLTSKKDQTSQACPEQLHTRAWGAHQTRDPKILRCWFHKAHLASLLASQYSSYKGKNDKI